jgi:hypothetical protein
VVVGAVVIVVTGSVVAVVDAVVVVELVVVVMGVEGAFSQATPDNRRATTNKILFIILLIYKTVL